MDGILKRLLTLNQTLWVLLVLCFLRFYGHHASNKALMVTRDLEVLSFLKGHDRDPIRSCASAALQERIDRQVQESDAGKRYLALRRELAAFLSKSTHMDDAELASAKRGHERAYFLVNPRLATVPGNADCSFTSGDGDAPPPRFDDAPDSVSTVLERGRIIALSTELSFPTQWRAPKEVKDVVPEQCLAVGAPGPIMGPAPPSPKIDVQTARAAAFERIVGRAPPSSSSVPQLSAAHGTRGGPLPSASGPKPAARPLEGASEGPAEPPFPKTHECRLAQVYFDGQGLHFVWSFEPRQGAQQESWSVTTALPIAGEKRLVKVPFLLFALSSVEQGWKDRLVELANSDSRQAAIKARYGGTGVDNALQQSQKIHAELVGSATLFGWNLLPDWFPVGLGAALAGVLFAVFATCRSAADLSTAPELAHKIRLVDSVFFLSLSSRIGVVITWLLVPVAVLMMSLVDGVTPISSLGLALAALGLTFGGLACAEWWKLTSDALPPPEAGPASQAEAVQPRTGGS